MAFTATTRIGDLVLDLPAAMRLFETLDIDYCCGGQRSLEQACAHAGQPLAPVLAQLGELQQPAPGPLDPAVWAQAPLSTLIDHIERSHHRYTRDELARLAPLMAKVAQVHGDRHPELAPLATCFQAVQADILPHLEQEEQVVFPAIRALEAGGAAQPAAAPIQALQTEHEALGELLRDIRTLTRAFTVPEDACGSFHSLYLGLSQLEQDLHLHIYLESHLLFPRALML